MPQPKAHHNRRQRKKLHLGEFQQLGFTVAAGCPADWNDERREQAMLALIDRIAALDLHYGGGDSASGMDGFVVGQGGRSCGEAERAALGEALSALGFLAVEVGPLCDAWYAEDATDDAP